MRLAEKRDRDAVLTYWTENRDHLAPYSPDFPRDFFSKIFWDAQILRNVDEFMTGTSVRLFVFEKDTKQVIGNVSLGGILRASAQFCYLGYGLAEDKQGQGFMTESVRPVVDYAFKEMNLHRIMANYIPTNERSGNLLRRLGFTVEGYSRDYLYLNGKWQDHILTSLTNPDWKPPAF